MTETPAARDGHATLRDAFLAGFARGGTRVALHFEGGAATACRDLTFHALCRQAAKAANALLELGLTQGDRVALASGNDVETACAHLGNMLAGLVTVPVSPKLPPEAMHHILADSGARVVLAGAETARQIAALQPELPELRTVLATSGDAPAGSEKYADLLAAAPDEVPRVDLKPEDWAIVCYTSGTTAAPKGVILTHRNVASNAWAVAEAWRWTEADTLLLCLPLYHVHGLAVGLHGAVVNASRLVLQRRFDMQTTWRAIERHRATMFFGVPPIYNQIVAADGLESVDLSSMRLFVSGSAPLTPATFEAFRERFGHTLLERYGMSETLMNLTNPCDGERVPGSVGFPFPGVEARCIDADAVRKCRALVDVPPGETGEIAIRGPNVFAGYLNLPEATAEAFCGGWFLTGDLATRDPTGRFRIVGRLSTDIIKTRAFKVSAITIENAIQRHPGVLEVAVIGVPHAAWGEAVLAVVVPRSAVARPRGGEVTAEQIVGHCRTHLAPHECPLHVEFVEAIPMTGPGKFKKRELIETYGHRTLREVRPG